MLKTEREAQGCQHLVMDLANANALNTHDGLLYCINFTKYLPQLAKNNTLYNYLPKLRRTLSVEQ